MQSDEHSSVYIAIVSIPSSMLDRAKFPKDGDVDPLVACRACLSGPANLYTAKHVHPLLSQAASRVPFANLRTDLKLEQA